MPYRRLPNTDSSRLQALAAALEKADSGFSETPVVPYGLVNDVRPFLLRFHTVYSRYRECLELQVKANRLYQERVKNARMYVSHFIQVLNLAFIRKEVKEEYRSLYGLEKNAYSVPDLVSDAALLEWGAKIIRGENLRLEKGGTPVYNPAIAKVSVHYDIFRESYYNQKNFQKSTANALKELTALRVQAHAFILEIWNSAESFFSGLPEKERLERCREYGLIYYYRKNELKND